MRRRDDDESVHGAMETTYDLLADSLPDDWEVAVVATSPSGRMFVFTDARDLHELAERVKRWDERRKARPGATLH